MKKHLFPLMILAALSCFACGNETVPVNAVPPPNIATPSPVPTTAQTKDGNYPGRGVVTKINTQLGSVELEHEEIVGLMPAMIMEFYVKDKSLLDSVSVGDKVDFVLEYKHPAETIVSLKKVPR